MSNLLQDKEDFILQSEAKPDHSKGGVRPAYDDVRQNDLSLLMQGSKVRGLGRGRKLFRESFIAKE